MFYSVTKDPQEKPTFELDAASYATSSLNLKTPIKTLKKFTKRINVSKSIPEAYMEDRVLYTDNVHVFWDSMFSVFYAHKPDWYLLNKLFIMDATGDYHRGKEIAFQLNESVRVQYNRTMATMKTLRNAVVAVEGYNSLGIPQFFNVKECVRLARRHKFKAWHHTDKAFLELRNVNLGDKQSGYMIYNKIIVVLKDWKIDGFLLRFNNFDYSSYWNIEAIVHPRLLTPFCHMDFGMTIASRQSDMDGFLLALKDSITEHRPARYIKSLPEITQGFMRYRSLWATHRFLTNDRTELSKEIFSKKNKGRP